VTDVRDLIQSTLDTALTAAKVYVFWQRKVEIAGDTNPDEYVVYTYEGDEPEIYADNVPLVVDSDATVKYFYRKDKLNSKTGRDGIKSRETGIKSALKAVGFTVSGPMDVGDVDGIGFYCSVFDCSYSEVV
jgi:hypothetical protein